MEVFDIRDVKGYIKEAMYQFSHLCTDSFPYGKYLVQTFVLGVRNFFLYGKYLVRTALHTNEQTNGMQLYVYRLLWPKGVMQINRFLNSVAFQTQG